MSEVEIGQLCASLLRGRNNRCKRLTVQLDCEPSHVGRLLKLTPADIDLKSDLVNDGVIPVLQALANKVADRQLRKLGLPNRLSVV